MAVNKVEVNGETVLDLTSDTVSEDFLLDGVTAHDNAGNPIEGKVKLSSVSIKDNEDGGIDISVDEQKKTVASQESVSQLNKELTQLKDGITALQTAQGGITWRIENGILYADYEEG